MITIQYNDVRLCFFFNFRKLVLNDSPNVVIITERPNSKQKTIPTTTTEIPTTTTSKQTLRKYIFNYGNISGVREGRFLE